MTCRRWRLVLVSGAGLSALTLLGAFLFCDILVGNSRVIVVNESGEQLRALEFSGDGFRRSLEELASGAEWAEFPDFDATSHLSFSCRNAGGSKTWVSTEAKFEFGGYLIEFRVMPDGRCEKSISRTVMPLARWFWRRPYQRSR